MRTIMLQYAKTHADLIQAIDDEVSWRSKRKTTVSLLSAKRGFIAASQCGQEVVYLHEIPKPFGTEHDCCNRVFEDNQACITMSENSVHRE